MLQERGESEGFQAVATMQQGKVVDLDATLALRAAKISAELKLPLAGSVMLATAQVHEAMLWTQEVDFEGVEGVEYVEKNEAGNAARRLALRYESPRYAH